MKARICDVCKTTVPDSDKKQMLYSISIEEAEDYVASNPAEMKLFLLLSDVCTPCTEKLRDAIEFIRTGGIKRKR